MNVYKPKQLSDKLQVSKETLRLWAEEGKLKTTKTEGGHRRYIYDEKIDSKESRLKFIYARVSSKKQENDLKRQIESLQKLYPEYKVISDTGSGLNFSRKGFCKLLEAIITGTVAEVVVAYKDRLCRFGFELFENLCKHFSTTITIINNNNDKSSTQELAEDLLSIITVFTARFYGKRKYNSNNNKIRRKRGGKLYYPKNKNLSKSTAKNII
jgi:predicted site-specific integrase-resolvase